MSGELQFHVVMTIFREKGLGNHYTIGFHDDVNGRVHHDSLSEDSDELSSESSEDEFSDVVGRSKKKSFPVVKSNDIQPLDLC
ncbi:hypothetical protein L484_008594 [Morus notabilis]|uniref:Uncharacterized protein n=1 Tax=Morus notabilis TaxID=981085 RepID=W9QRT6_9ROSA|nr:hypothetical protein L484_008594 [Morus notabilis]